MCTEYLYWWLHYHETNGKFNYMFVRHFAAQQINVWDANYGNVDGSY